MLSHPENPERYVLSTDDLEDSRMPEAARPYADKLRTVTEWARNYLAEPHPDLGRGGPVCPYVPTALKRRLFYLTVCPLGSTRAAETIAETMAETVGVYRDWFRRIEPLDSMYKTILMLFPDAAPTVIDSVQADLKSSFVEQGLMLGQFHHRPPVDAGLWNADFRPLRCPVPLLAIRNMVPTDLPFLVGDRRFLNGYRQVFGEDLPSRQREQLAVAMARIDGPSRVA